jgi:hypothetical protein
MLRTPKSQATGISVPLVVHTLNYMLPQVRRYHILHIITYGKERPFESRVETLNFECKVVAEKSASGLGSPSLISVAACTVPGGIEEQSVVGSGEFSASYCGMKQELAILILISHTSISLKKFPGSLQMSSSYSPI